MPIWGLLRVSLHLLRGMATCAFVFPWLDQAGRNRRVQRWSRKLMDVCKIELEFVDCGGAAQAGQAGAMVVCNHLSWADIFVINALAPCHFVAKSEIRAWPLIGWLAAKSGTVFIERGNRRDVRRIFEGMVKSIHAGDRIAFFPEGTTSIQGQVLPFHANLFEAAINGGVPVQPYALRYVNAQGEFAHAIDFVGETSFAQSMVLILRNPGIKAQLMLMPPLPTTGAHRRELAQQARQIIAGQLGVDCATDTGNNHGTE